MAYVAVGRVCGIDVDPADKGLFYARIDDFLEFDRPVAYRDVDGRFLERMLRELDSPAVAGRTDPFGPWMAMTSRRSSTGACPTPCRRKPRFAWSSIPTISTRVPRR